MDRAVPEAGELRELLGVARRAAAIAGDVIMPLYEAGVTVELKADRTPVTNADRDAEAAVRAFLSEECPTHGVLGEEFGETPGSDPRYRWILDPIDGTKSFIHHVPLFGSLVALEYDGEPVVGVIACHAAGETVHAATGLGAFVGDVRVRVSDTTALADATVCTTTIAGLARHHADAFTELCDAAGLLRAWGDCYGYLMVATGRADVMLDPVMNLWDVAALAPVVREAGGRLTRWSGDDAIGDSAVASNGILHDAVLSLLHQHRVGG